jgi:hypothetical protein
MSRQTNNGKEWVLGKMIEFQLFCLKYQGIVVMELIYI